MITKASIRNFKGIAECDIDDLNRINVFVGKNDVCKSSILESIYYTLKEFTGPHLPQVIGRRTNAFFEARELWYGYQTRSKISVDLVFDDSANAKLGISHISHPPLDFDIECEGTMESEKSRSTHTVSTYNYIRHKFKPPAFYSTRFLDILSENMGTETTEYISGCRFLDSSNRNDIESMEELFRLISNKKKTSTFNRFLREIFDKESNVRIGRTPAQESTPIRYRVALIRRVGKLRRTIFLGGLGDGIRYGMQILGAGLISKNTSLFIEEIESNQHPASLRKLIDFLAETSFENDLQLFITTHSDLAVRYFWHHFRKSEFKEDRRARSVKYFHVTRDINTGKVECTPYDPYYPTDAKVVESDLFGLGE